MVGEQSGSNGTVVNLEQITASGTWWWAARAPARSTLLGVAASVLDGGADIGQLGRRPGQRRSSMAANG